ncbi:helix-turn-helix domain-containing protein [Enterococcus sp. DIV1420a]|uniref:helix-turn-helix domain-containing protein n=1 Tax=Enterococcus sp. DIV1420a TaxID=2774672 RepID=UPI003F254561
MVEKRKSYYSLVPISIVLSAVDGDPISIKIILKHYNKYMVSLCLSKEFDEAGRLTTYMDEFMLRQLETKLIEAILKFKVK